MASGNYLAQRLAKYEFQPQWEAMTACSFLVR
jgi:hypothetical protein